MNVTKSEYLHKVLFSHKMTHVKDLMGAYVAKRDEVKERIEGSFGSQLAQSPVNSGSYAKHTAINCKFDIDLFVPFCRDSFTTLDEMYRDVLDFFESGTRFVDLDLVGIRRQKTSIGLGFVVGGKEIEMDVVPGRELKQGTYGKEGDVNLHVNDEGLQSIKTNIRKHIELISGKSAERSIIRLLKVWNYRGSVGLKSFLIELLVLEALKDSDQTGLWDRLEIVLKFVQDNIRTIELQDPANSNNIVTDTLSEPEKDEIGVSIATMLARIGEDDSHLRYYFPENEEFQKRGSVYIRKGNQPSELDTQSFGQPV